MPAGLRSSGWASDENPTGDEPHDTADSAAGISAQDLAQEAEALLARFPNALVNADERRRLRAALYRPLLGLGKEERGRMVDLVLAILLDGHGDAAS